MLKRSASISFLSSLSRPARLAWLLLLALSPVAYVAGAWVLLRADPNARANFEIDRVDALRLAADYAANLGLNVQSWTSGAKVEVNQDRYYYYQLHRNRESEVMRRLAPEAYIHVRFISPDRQEALDVELSGEGQLLGYRLTVPPGEEVPDAGEAGARDAAAAAFHELQLQQSLPNAPAPTFSENREFASVSRRYTWQPAFAALPGVETQIAVVVLGDRVITKEVTTRFDPAYAREHFVNQRPLTKLALVPFGLLIFFVACYGLYRYLQRTWQKEVPHARSLLLGAVLSVAFFFIALQSEFYIFGPPIGANKAGIYWIMLMGTVMVFAVMGMAMGLAYGSGEGDVREAYPGKLTSLDALLSGRLLSRNVARAICTGAALGGWALLTHSLVLLPWATDPSSGLGLAAHFYDIFFGRFSWLLPLINPLLGAIQIAVTGLLLPLSLLSRSRRIRGRRRLLLGALIVLSLVASLGVFQEQTMPFAAGLAVAAARTTFLLLLFFSFDLLTAIVGIAAPSLIVFVLYFMSQPAPSLQRAGLLAAGFALTVLLVELVFVFKGHEYGEDQVRPLYARHLAERSRLQAEVSAAREAQVRLLPQKLPQVPGLSLAAACLPAHVVGGDFYDFFPLDDHKLGIFVAEGGDQGLGSALTIAFAKGFLMPRIAAGHTPTEIICDLQERLASLLGTSQDVSLAYAIINPSERSLRYARVGSYPQFRVSREREDTNGGLGHKKAERRFDLRPEERDVSTNDAAPRENASPDGNNKCAVREATMSLTEGDAIIIVTDGIVKNLKSDKQQHIEEWAVGLLSSHQKATHATLQEALDRALEKRSKRSRKIGVEDDLTAVVLRLESTVAGGGGGAAS